MKFLKIGLISTLLASTLFASSIKENKIKRLNPSTIVNASGWGFSQIVIPPKEGKVVYIAGQFAGDINGKVIAKTMKEQMRFSYENLKLAIEAAGGKPENVLMIRILIKDYEQKHLEHFVKEQYALFGKDNLPASTLIPVPRLALDDMMFEIEAQLFIPDTK